MTAENGKVHKFWSDPHADVELVSNDEVTFMYHSFVLIKRW